MRLISESRIIDFPPTLWSFSLSVRTQRLMLINVTPSTAAVSIWVSDSFQHDRIDPARRTGTR